MYRRASASVLLTGSDLGELLATANTKVIAALQSLGAEVALDSLADLLSEWSATLAADGSPTERPQTDWLPHSRTVQDIQRSHQLLRTAILAQLPEDTGLSARASELFGQLFDKSTAQANESLLRRLLAETAEPKEVRREVEDAPGNAPRERDAIEVERANFANLFRQTPEMVCITSGPEHRFELVNQAHVRVLGFDATNMTVREAQPESVEVHHILDDVYRTGKTAELREIPVTVTDRLRYFNLTYAARYDAAGAIDGIMILGSEVTDQVLFRQSNQLHQQALELALGDAPLEDVLAVLAKMVELQSGTDLRASILLIDDEGRHLLHGAAPSLPAAYSEAIHGLELGPLAGSCGTAAHERALVIVEDIENDARWKRYKHLALAHGLRACWSVPILTAQGKLLGTFALYAQTVRRPTAREIQIGDIAVRTTALILSRRREICERMQSVEALRERDAELDFALASAKQRALCSGVSIDLTDKKLGQLDGQRLVDAISKEREKLEQVLEQSAVCTALLEGPHHVYSFANSAYLRTFDLDKSILGRPLGEVFPKLSEQGYVVLLDEVYATGKTYEGRERRFDYETRSGEVRSQYFDFSYAANRDSTQRIDGVLVTIINVTDRVLLREASDKADALLLAERFNLNQIIQKSPAAMATWIGPNLVFERVNPEYAKIFPGRQLVGKALLDACPELRGQGFDSILRRVLETGEPYSGHQSPVQIAQTPGGPLEERYFDFTYLRINDQDGNPYCVYDFALDVTDRVLAQRRAEEATTKLREAEDLLSRAIEVSNIGFFNWDVTNNNIVFSAQMQKDWGIEANTTLEVVMAHIHPDERDYVRRAVAKTVAEGGKYFAEYRVLRPTDGRMVWIEAQGGLVPDRQGRLTRFIGTSLDITQRKSAEEQLRAASIEAHNASSAKSAFLANMSHEIRTPLGAIMGFAELLKKPELPPSSRASFVAVIERNSQHLLRIVDDILDLSKVEAGKMVFEHIELALPELLSDFASLMGLRARDKGIHFALLISSPIPTLVISDPTRLRQILNNIVGNAIKFTDRGGVELSVRYEDQLLEFAVRDTGRGISQEQAGRLFQAFVQADESITRKFGGTGLGLVLTRRLVAAMGGEFYLKESTPAVGSTFVARIKVGVPRGTPFADDQTLGLAAEVAAAPERRLTGMRVLVIDDSLDNRTLLSVMLEDAGATVESATDGQDGVELALAKHFDAVLMDIQMPRMDGYQAIELLNSSGYKVPIIALTAHAMVEERERAQGKGFAAFMTKPIQRDSLLHLLDTLRGRPHASDAPVLLSPAPAAPEPSRSVLIVEDSVDSSEVMEMFLSSLGCQVRCARSGQEAMSTIDEGFVPSLVLLDLTLPDMSGREVLEAVRRIPACKEARIVIVSGWDNLQQRAQEMGADGYLRKPISLTDLQALA